MHKQNKNKGQRKLKKDYKNAIVRILIFVLFITGAAFLLYPTANDIYNRWNNEKLNKKYLEKIRSNSDEENKSILKEAENYNKEHTTNAVKDVFDDEENISEDSKSYMNTLNPNKDGMMCYVEVPKANISLAVFHGASRSVLEKGVAHLEGTNLPIGGRGNHAVFAAHRGLPSAKLFTDLDNVQEGNRFYIHVLNRTLAYKIDRIKVVAPENISMYFNIDKKEDYVTLMTCTPYGVNTHRLLIRGHRVPMGNHREINPLTVYLMFTICALIVVSIVLVMIYVYKRRKNVSKAE